VKEGTVKSDLRPVSARSGPHKLWMEEQRIRRLPVTGSCRLVGMITEADVAPDLPDESVAECVEMIYADF